MSVTLQGKTWTRSQGNIDPADGRFYSSPARIPSAQEGGSAALVEVLSGGSGYAAFSRGAQSVVEILAVGAGQKGAEEGDLEHGDAFTVTGSGFGSHDLNFDFLGYHIEGTSVSSQPSSRSGWNFSGTGARLQKLGYDDSTRGRVLRSPPGNGGQLNAAIGRALGTSVGFGTKVYVSYWAYADATGLAGSSGGQFKQIRIRYDDDVDEAEAADIYINYHEGGDRMIWIGDSGFTFALYASGGQSFTPNAWRRIEMELTTPTSQNSNTGICLVRIHNSTNVPTNKSYSHSSGQNNANGNLYPNSRRITTVLFQGYLGNGASGSIVQDDHYVQLGTAKRVELCNHATYTSATRREIQPLTAWSGSSVSGTINRGAFANGTYYLHVVGENNTSLASQEIELTG